ncbi:hypothetical protein [Kordia sp.]|uniref:hypothetical protein n=1 Tax=Kordia sp. TaxID=1965332 RepID=UPI003B59B7C9
MKKKDIHIRLQLRKRIVSNVDNIQIKGGTDGITSDIAVTANETVRLTTLVTAPENCETKGDVCTFYCRTKDMCN